MNLELGISNYLEIVLRMKNSFLLLLVLVFFGYFLSMLNFRVLRMMRRLIVQSLNMEF